MYSIVWSKSATKDLRKLPKNTVGAVVAKVESLGIDPRPNGVKKMKGVLDLYRVRQGDYRIIYQIRDGQLLLLVVQVGHRREVYRQT